MGILRVSALMWPRCAAAERGGKAGIEESSGGAGAASAVGTAAASIITSSSPAPSVSSSLIDAQFSRSSSASKPWNSSSSAASTGAVGRIASFMEGFFGRDGLAAFEATVFAVDVDGAIAILSRYLRANKRSRAGGRQAKRKSQGAASSLK